MNSTANRYPCRLPSALFMLFLPTLLFFLLGAGTPALAGFENSPSFPITYSGMDYKRGHGYWRLEVTDVELLVVYIGAKEDGPLAVDANKGSADLDVACKRARVFVRILSESDYLDVAGERHPGTFDEIQNEFRGDKITITITNSRTDKARAVVKLIEHPALTHSNTNLLAIPIIYAGNGMNYERGHGLWQPTDGHLRVVLYIGPEPDGSLVLHYDVGSDLNVALKGMHLFVRIWDKSDYLKATNKEYPSSEQFPTIQEAYRGDHVTVTITRARRAVVRLIKPPALAPSQGSWNIPINGVMDYKRGSGYWRPMIDVQYPLVAFISSNEGSPLVLNFGHANDLNVACRMCSFVRILDEKDYVIATGKEYSRKGHSRKGQFPNVPELYRRDRIQILIWSEGEIQHTDVRYIRSLNVTVICSGMDHQQGVGYWRPVKKHDNGVPVRLVAYIGPENTDVKLDYVDERVLRLMCNRRHDFMRITTADEYREAIGEEYPTSIEGDFPLIQVPSYENDRVTVNLQLKRGCTDIACAVRATFKLKRREMGLAQPVIGEQSSARHVGGHIAEMERRSRSITPYIKL